jgi:demethylmenaquinone methyltransferase/2-methoxy-6-polyprenyl-1,4-benzoquinol methylase
LVFPFVGENSFCKPSHKPATRLKIIDLLTGMGETWTGIRNKFPNSNLTVLDFSDEMLKYAKQKSNLKFNNEVKVLQRNILNNQLPDNHYDFVTCAFGLKTFNTEQLHILASETKRILKQGGEFSFIEVSKPKNKIMKLLYAFHLGKVVPLSGRLLLGNPDEYRMLWQYTKKFDNALHIADIFAQAGLKTFFKSYFFGCATGFYGTKTAE